MNDSIQELSGGCIRYSLRGELLITLFIKPRPEGFIVGVAHPKVGDIHLNCLFKEGRISWHITDRSQPIDEGKSKTYPLGKHISEDLFAKRMDRMMKKIVRKYHGNQRAWVMTEQLKMRIQKAREEYDPDPSRFPLELLRTEIVCDFENGGRWQRVKIRDLLKRPGEQGFILENGVVRIVQPINERILLCYSARQFNRFLSFILGCFGLYEYIEYLKDKDHLKK